MRGSQKLTLAGLLALVGIAAAGLILTSRPPASSTKPASQAASDQAPVAEERLLATAHTLAALAVSPQEQELANEAVRLADRDVDLGFADALRSASQQSAPANSDLPKLQERIARLQSEIKATQGKISQLKAQAARAKGSKQADLESRLELAQAELDLHLDTLADAQNDLARSGESAYAQIERLWQQHEATQHSKQTPGSQAKTAPNAATEGAAVRGGLVARSRAWLHLRNEQMQLLQARQESRLAGKELSRKHQLIKQDVQSGSSGAKAAVPAPRKASKAKPVAPSLNPSEETAAALSHLRHLSQDEKTLTDLDTRILDLRQLGGVYGQWAGRLAVRERAALHATLSAALWILVAILIAYLAGQLLERALARLGLDRKQRMTLHTVTRFTLDVLTVLVVLLIIFGSPRNMPTIVGLAGAGLAVALKDFIVSFFGWFILTGRHGIRIGDWVEINGVRGEAIEITLLRTILLETGNWNEPGHPTGRKASFLNSYAVEGCYFNFTTSGQYLWDEIRTLIPWGIDPFPIMAKIDEAVKKATKRYAEIAEREWQRAAHGYSVKAFSATPSVNLRTIEDGVEVAIHYVCPVTERYQWRCRLSDAAVELIYGAKARESAAEL